MEEALPANDDNAKDERNAAISFVMNTIDDGLIYLIKNLPRHPAVLLAKICEFFQPTDGISKHELYGKIHAANLEQFDNDFMKLAVDIKRSSIKLGELGETVTPTFLIESLTARLEGPQIHYH